MKIAMMVLFSTLLLPNQGEAVPPPPKVPAGIQTHLPQDVKKPPKQVRAARRSLFQSAN